MTREAFLNLKIPILPYCENGFKRGSSNQYWESFHIKNSNTGVQINLYWQLGDTVTLSVYDNRMRREYQKNQRIIDRADSITDETLEKYCRQYLS